MTHDTLIIHPDRFEDMAQAIVNTLYDTGILTGGQLEYDKSISMVMRQLQHQLWLHRNWHDDYESSVTKFRADQSDAEQEAARAIDG